MVLARSRRLPGRMRLDHGMRLCLGGQRRELPGPTPFVWEPEIYFGKTFLLDFIDVVQPGHGSECGSLHDDAVVPGQ